MTESETTAAVTREPNGFRAPVTLPRRRLPVIAHALAASRAVAGASPR
ncbi:hypothetical protein [Streptomyces neyagawaensis]|nr:hypothetical protein [Streptomyces neyagawaensis]MCL6736123.1 hypothetical protein [Streptomyces neyagawaensis]MDE1688446.1 hypothetical protein [Streptomyces neyagawaensis]